MVVTGSAAERATTVVGRDTGRIARRSSALRDRTTRDGEPSTAPAGEPLVVARPTAADAAAGATDAAVPVEDERLADALDDRRTI